MRWAAEQFSEAERAALMELSLTLSLPDLPDLLIVHATLRADRDSLMAHTPNSELAAMFPGLRERWVVRAHDHAGQVRLWRDHTIVTAGSVGLPLNSRTTAQYLLLDQRGQLAHPAPVGRVQSWRHAAALHERHRLPEAAGPFALLLLREVATASFYAVPFLNAYGAAVERGGITLAAAVERFLSAGWPA